MLLLVVTLLDRLRSGQLSEDARMVHDNLTIVLQLVLGLGCIGVVVMSLFVYSS